jgi:hypothetical protein
MILTEDASIGALRHEFRHFLDMRNAGFPSFGRYMANPDEFWQIEFNGYVQEVNIARSIGRFDIGRAIVEQMRVRRAQILGKV